MTQLAGDGARPDDGVTSESLMPDDFLPEDFRPDPAPRRHGLRPAQWRLMGCLAVVVAALGWVAIRA